MKKGLIIIAVACVLSILIIFAVLYWTSSETPSGQIPSAGRVNMIIKKGTLTRKGATVIITDNNVYHYGYTVWFRIEKKEDGEWKELPLMNQYEFDPKYYYPKKNGQLKWKLKWTEIYGELENGEYRIVKRIGPEELRRICMDGIYYSIENSYCC